jgi:hypothetical protein
MGVTVRRPMCGHFSATHTTVDMAAHERLYERLAPRDVRMLAHLGERELLRCHKRGPYVIRFPGQRSYNWGMGRHMYLATHLSLAELEQRYRAAYEPHERSWWQMLGLLARGQTATAIADLTGYNRAGIGQIAKR